jgi:hypothetical protein
MTQENWIFARLKDRCGNSGDDLWTKGATWMARVGIDSTKTPPEERMAHEYHISSKKCPGDERVVYLDLLFFREAAKELYNSSPAPDQEIKEETKKKPE